jgi:hypothetical protein
MMLDPFFPSKRLEMEAGENMAKLGHGWPPVSPSGSTLELPQGEKIRRQETKA